MYKDFLGVYRLERGEIPGTLHVRLNGDSSKDVKKIIGVTAGTGISQEVRDRVFTDYPEATDYAFFEMQKAAFKRIAQTAFRTQLTDALDFMSIHRVMESDVKLNMAAFNQE